MEQLLKALDSTEMEVALCRELQEYKDEIFRQMELTDKLTNQYKGNKKSYLEVENCKYTKLKRAKNYFSSIFSTNTKATKGNK